MIGPRFAEGFLDQLFDGHGFHFAGAVAGQEAHLIDQAADAFDAFLHGAGQGLLEFRVANALLEQLLMGGNGHDGVADFVGHALGHLLHQPQIGGFDFQMPDAVGRRAVLHHQQGRGRRPRHRPGGTA